MSQEHALEQGSLSAPALAGHCSPEWTDSRRTDSSLTTEIASPSYTIPSAEEAETGIWGFLEPCGASSSRINFHLHCEEYSIGRSPDNSCVLPGKQLSQFHCNIRWDHASNLVTIFDLSRNGTFKNGKKIDHSALLIDRDEVVLGVPDSNGLGHYRYIFHFVAGRQAHGRLQDEYDICPGELGRGAFAIVKRVLHRPTGVWYAVKIISRNQAGPHGTVHGAEAFRREISILQRLDHPNICRFKEAIIEPRVINIVLEYVPGGNLHCFVKSRGILTEQCSQRFTYQICLALNHIHGQKIVHRDLKPENILVTSDRPRNIKLADFGLSKAINSLTGLHTDCGTPAYMAPEVLIKRYEKGYEHLVDSWSLGVVIFYMLAGRIPFDKPREPSAYAPEPSTFPAQYSARIIKWSLLMHCRVSGRVKSFMRRLLDHDPRIRMSPALALHHPWLSRTSQSPTMHQHITPTTAISARNDHTSIPILDEAYGGTVFAAAVATAWLTEPVEAIDRSSLRSSTTLPQRHSFLETPGDLHPLAGFSFARRTLERRPLNRRGYVSPRASRRVETATASTWLEGITQEDSLRSVYLTYADQYGSR
ncbi:kinase-like protein [Obba rivulosa]|uniref:Kinase-like protein n=1 Tax=Obba rivulosa TaxID=1052685 RepID=A0A8E2DJ82_9APHY|nr:kinase-like protein [Obba rivulosa]